jgi:stage III sporulation protein SpoIIIAA
VDTSNEIGGDGDIPHAAIGGARRMQVPEPSMQHRVMIEAVENHMPEVVIVDEIGTEAEAQACRSIAERGVMLIGTAHGERLANIIKNPVLSDLVCHYSHNLHCYARSFALDLYYTLLLYNFYMVLDSKWQT